MNPRPELSTHQVRGLLIQRGSSLAEWAREHGYLHQVVYRAVLGKRRGPQAKRIVRQLKEELGL